MKLPIKNWVIGTKGFYFKDFFRHAMKLPIKIKAFSISEDKQWSCLSEISNAWSKWSCYTQTVIAFHTRGELSNRSKRRCLHEDETWIQRIGLEHQHGCRFFAEWQNVTIITWCESCLQAVFSSFPFFLFFLFFFCNYINHELVLQLRYIT